MLTRNSTFIYPARVIITAEGMLATREGPCKIVRKNYCIHHKTIFTTHDLRATLRAGSVTTWGGYPLFFVTQDCASLCFKCVRKEYVQVSTEIRNNTNNGFRVGRLEINYEDATLTCDRCSELIKSAYGIDHTVLGTTLTDS